MVLYGLCALCFFETCVFWEASLFCLSQPVAAVAAQWAQAAWRFLPGECVTIVLVFNHFHHFFIHFSWCLLIIIYSQLFWLANGASGTEKAAPLAAGLSGTVLDAKLLGNVGMMEDQESWLEHDWKMIGWWNWVVVNASAVSTWIFWRFAAFLMFN